MPLTKLKNFHCNYLFQDFGKEKTLVFSNSLGTNFSMWDDNIQFLSPYFNILRYDKRGHGGSSISQDVLSISDLGSDVIELLDFFKIEKAVFCGLSIGGLTGQWLGIHHPERFEKIIISNTAAKIGTDEGWNSRIIQVKEHGLGSILEGTADRWFTPEYRSNFPEKVQKILEDFQANSLQGYTACCKAVATSDFRTSLKNLSVPTLIIAGTEDLVTTVEDGQFLQKHIPKAELKTLRAAHLSNMEHPKSFSEFIFG